MNLGSPGVLNIEVSRLCCMSSELFDTQGLWLSIGNASMVVVHLNIRSSLLNGTMDGLICYSVLDEMLGTHLGSR